MTQKKAGDKKRYRNAGVSQLILEGVEINPGDEFETFLEPHHETQLLMGGHIELLKDQSEAADRAQAEEAGETTERKSRRSHSS